MIPTNLKISNFTSYGADPQELDFSKFHMAAISGHNGAGKSSLLDSITWCLWGSSRLGDNSDSLIRLGQESMYVELSFKLDDNIYIVKRQRSKKSGGSSALEFWSGTHNLTEGTIKATQQKIIDTLHLTYETFTNSAFLRQGHADEFTTKGATDRKRILADILGLAHYDLLEERAKEKSKDKGANLQLLDYQLLEIEAELSQKDEREKQASQAKEEAEAAEEELKEVETLIKELDLKREVVLTKFKSLEEKLQRLETAKKEISDISLQIQTKEKATDDLSAILSKKEEIEKGCQKLSELQDQKKQLESKRSELIKVKDDLAEIQKKIIELEDRRSRKITDLEVAVKKLETENESKQREVDHLRAHKDSCPTCGQAIGEEKNSEIIKKNEDELKINNEELAKLTSELDKIKGFVLPQKSEATAKELEVKKFEEETKDWISLNSQINEYQKYEDLNLKLQQANSSISAQLEAIEDLKKILSTKQDQIKEEEKELEVIESVRSQLKEVEMEQQAKVTIKNELSQKAMSARTKLGAAESLRDKAKQLEDHKDKKSSEQAVLKKEKALFDELALAFGKKGIQAMIIETAIPEIEEETNKLLDRLTEGRMRVALVTQKETKTKVAGTGEKGIVETLDIIISDEMGERPYEAYSGGEQFRVNFAIRLSLSKLLTNRAGSKLQFLVIDEGFGTQDAEGRSRIVEALDAIKDDFEKVLIITHLDELKEEFPARIEVLKGATGSRFELVG